MSQTRIVFAALAEGAIGAFVLVVIAFMLSRFTREIIGRALLAIFLFVAAGAYFGFATLGREVAGTSTIWMLIEVIQVVVFGAMALEGLRGSPYWLAAGWALHPLWDVPVHLMGPGHPFTPWGYAVACVSFDLLVALYIAVAYQMVGAHRLGLRVAS